MASPSQTGGTRRRQISLSTSRSVPNLVDLDPSLSQLAPGITVHEATPRSPRAANLYIPMPSPLLFNSTTETSEFDQDADVNLAAHSSHSPSSASSSGSSSPILTHPPDYTGNLSATQVSQQPSHKLSRSRSFVHTVTTMATFAPPFYNRPPTPLPPSPSLTSLLRPTFSTTTSRPTTPDESENDTQNDTEAAVAKSARIAETVPRASPKVPTYEYYGFVLYLTSSACFLVYILWSYLPSPFLHQLGIYYYPNRWWSLAIPAFLVALGVYIYVALACYNVEVLTLPMNNIKNLVDETANIAALDDEGRIITNQRRGSRIKQRKLVKNRTLARQNEKYSNAGSRIGAVSNVGSSPGEQNVIDWDWKHAWSEGTDAVMDVPLGGVCQILYGSG